ncbi:MAG: phytase [Synechococcales bacterium]|nr:phytase [Synechococcales bacterium]
MSQSTVRFSQFNASLNRNANGQLVQDLSTANNAQAKAVAETIQRVNPDVLLINEFDYVQADPLAPVKLFQQNYLGISQNGATPVDYPYVYIAPSNTGIASGFDLNNNGQVVTTPGTPGYGDDSFGFGNFPGQFGMVLFSKYPIEVDNIRTFQNFLWKDMPGNLLTNDPSVDNLATPVNENLGGFYSTAEQAVLRLSSKSHWDVPILVNGEVIHALVSHPTPPVFDGAEDRNGKRNADEIRFWADYISPGKGGYIYDDQGDKGGLTPGSSFVIMGDQNADPYDGDSYQNAVLQLLQNPNINTNSIPTSPGAPQQAGLQGNANNNHRGNPAFDTADFADTTPGNLRADYVLPSIDLAIQNSRVFWPLNTDPTFSLVGTFTPSLPGGFPSSDHRMVWVDVVTSKAPGKTVLETELVGQQTFATGFVPAGAAGTIGGRAVPMGGLSGVTYDAAKGVYYAISDDRSQFGPARFYTYKANSATDNQFTNVTVLKQANGQPYNALTIDPEDIVLTKNNTVFISSEGEANIAAGRVDRPFINEYSLQGDLLRSLPIPTKFIPIVRDTNGNGVVDAGDTQISGIRNNLAFESLTITPNQQFLYTANEDTLFQDGAVASATAGGQVRIVQYNLLSGQPEKEYLYQTDAVADQPPTPTSFNTNGLVDLLAIDDQGTFLALERSFTAGVPGTGNTIKIYEISLQGATDISFYNSLSSLNPTTLQQIQPAQKRLILNLNDLNLPTGTDNIEGIELGPKLADGSQSIVLVSDNNFSATQFTQILTLSADLVPTVRPSLETRPDLFDDDSKPRDQRADADDPAIYLHPTDSSQSLVLTVVKNAGLRVYDLGGNLVQEVNPGGIRYNNIDLQYGFKLDGKSVDIALASDRNNDKLVIFKIDPSNPSQPLQDITDSSIGTLFQGAPYAAPYSASNRSAYGVALYRSPLSQDYYAFVNRRQTGDVAQYKLIDKGNGKIGAELVRNFTVPTTAGRDAQLEGMVVDQELGYLYIGQEDVGIWKFSAEPSGGQSGTLIDRVKDLGGQYLEQDVEGLTIYYGKDGKGYLLASSQGNNTFIAYEREGFNTFVGRFAVGNSGSIDSVQESDGADVINVPLGPNYPFGLFVTQDGDNLPAKLDAEGENINTNFKFVPWENIANAIPGGLTIDTTSYNPRAPQAQSLVNGVTSGDTTQTSTVLWARSTFAGAVTFEYSTDRTFSTIAGKATATVTNPNLPVKVEITGLQAGTEYFYRVTDAAGDRELGEFKTANNPGTYGGFRMGVSGDWRGELAPYPAIANADDRNLDLFILNGDTIYSDYASPAVRNPDGSEKEQATSLDEFRLKHAEVYGSRNGQNFWQDLRSKTSVMATVDDHEVTNDFEGGEDLAKQSAAQQQLYGANRGLVNDSPLYETGMQAFQEYNPIRDEFYGETGDPRTAGERKLYRYNTFGSDAATFILDTRSFRDSGLPAANLTNPTEFLVNSFNPQRTFLGRPQVEDLKRDLLAAERDGITWKFITVPEPIQNLGVLAASDRFEGYAAERTEILKFIDDNKISNVVFVAADIHGTVVNNLTYQLAPGGAQIATSAFEITTGSVAFDAPFGQTVAELAAGLGLLTPAQKSFYDSLPIANDADDLPNDKDDFIKGVVNDGLRALGYDPVGLNNNLSQANGLINAKLLQGDYSATHTYGWTEFHVDATTQKLVVTTYGIAPYSREELLANPAAVLARQPKVVSQFEVDPQRPNAVGTVGDDTLFGSNGDDFINALGGNNIVYAGEGNNTIRAGSGNDVFYTGAGNDVLDAGNGNNVLYAGEGRNQITTGSGNDTIYVGAGDDIIKAGSGNNIIYAGEGRNQITTGAGNNSIYAGAADDLIAAGAGVNTIYAGEGNNTVTSTGLDTIYLGNGRDRLALSTGAGEATVIGFGHNDLIQLGSGLKFSDLTLNQTGFDTVVSAGSDRLATLKWTQVQQLTAAQFV